MTHTTNRARGTQNENFVQLFETALQRKIECFSDPLLEGEKKNQEDILRFTHALKTIQELKQQKHPDVWAVCSLIEDLSGR